MAVPAQAVIHEVDTEPWLDELSRRAGRHLTLADVPDDEWDRICVPGVDAVWLMGVWERSPAGAKVLRANAGYEIAFREALPDVTDDDVRGSPFCVRSYTVDAAFGGDGALADARRRLAARGVKLVLDYVPNHVAPDCGWTETHPNMFLRGDAGDRGAAIEVRGELLACGRDPYFPPWPDVLQINAFSPTARAAAADTLRAIARRADGVRVDMAMLFLNDVFASTWGARAGARPPDEFWDVVLGDVHATHPDLLVFAEVYWDLEPSLLAHGFDACYDKRLYDRLVTGDGRAVRAHLAADASYQRHLVRFIENHDEARAAAAFSPEAHRAAAVAVATLPGTTLWHEGQLDGRRLHLPVPLGRRPSEPVDAELREFYLRLLAAAPQVRRGGWRLCPASGWPDNASNEHVVTWTWTAPDARTLVVVNIGAEPAQARVHPGWVDLPDGDVHLDDPVAGTSWRRSAAELCGEGLFVDLAPWAAHVLTIRT